MLADIIDLNCFTDERGSLVAIEALDDVPFEIKRIYYINNVGQGYHRGFHAHKSLLQLLICVNGSCKVLLDNGNEREVVLLDSHDKGILLTTPMWREMFDFSKEAVMLVLASDHYDPDDYIKDYDLFLEYMKGLK